MDDLSEKLAELLNDPESFEQLREMAESVLGGQKTNNESRNEPSPDLNSAADGIDLDPVQITKIMSLLSQLKSSGNDSRSKLLLALKPLLSPPRREKVDTAIKLLKLIDMLPMLRDSGIFDF